MHLGKEAIEHSDILIVDDTPANLRLLSGMLHNDGYHVRAVPNGDLGLQAVANAVPDLILLDINMPGMNGYEVCERLKQDERYKDIPIIFISALNETEDKVKAFDVGGVDYISKPFQFDEVRKRVNTHLSLSYMNRQLEQANAELSQKNHQLQQLERYRDELVHMIVHDLKSPLVGISGFLELLEVATQLDETQGDYVGKARTSTQTLLRMINSLLDVNRLESGLLSLDMQCGAVAELYAGAVEELGGVLVEREVNLSIPDGDFVVCCDRTLIERVMVNLLSNAVKYSPQDKPITVSLALRDGAWVAQVEDQGPGIPDGYTEMIFEKFGQLEMHKHKHKYSSGIGLTFCKLAVEAHGGQIGVDNREGGGSCFWFSLPVHQP